jgi:hypothetical protein
MTRSPVRAVVTALAGLAFASITYSQSVTESRLKAAVVSKFPQFVEWPAEALSGRSTLDICVLPLAQDSFGPDLQALVAGETVNGLEMTVRPLNGDGDLEGCHLLFLPGRLVPARRSLLERATARPILTVGEDQQFLDRGGIVRLHVVGGRMRFDVNAEAAGKVGLRISSQLLQLALTVRGTP